MNSDVLTKVDEIIAIIDSSDDVKRFMTLKENLLANKELINKISLLKDETSYDSKYIDQKKEILLNPEFREYKELENDLYFLIQEINLKLGTLLKVKNNENN